MSDDELKARYRQWLARAPHRSGAAPTVEQIAALVAGTGTDEERLALIDRIMADPALEREYALLSAAHAAGQQLTGTGARSWRPTRLAMAAAIATALIGGTLLWRAKSPATDVVRGGTPAGAGGVTLVAPLDGYAADGAPLIWRRDRKADDYIVELLGAGGDSLIAVVTTDTVLALDAVPSANAAASWRVIGRRSDGTTVASDVRRFQRTTP